MLDGRACANDSQDDIVAEWQEPKRIKGWVNLVKMSGDNDYCTNGVWHTKKEAQKKGIGPASACIEIDCLEGEGLK
jgi:hypothetical protein